MLPRVLFLAVGACAAFTVSPPPPDTTFLVMGDWGGSPSGSTPAQVKVAEAMDRRAAQTGASFTITLGDNFYKSGIPTDVTDPRFQTTFEDVYNGTALQAPNHTFYLIAGNHDHQGNISAQIAYTNVSERWFYPSLYYTFNKTTPSGRTVQFVMIDTIVLSGVDFTEDEGDDSDDDQSTANNTLVWPRPEEPAESVGDSVTPAGVQLAWLKSTLAASTADYLIVAGHYPVWSVCANGPMLVGKLKPLLEEYKVSAYFFGHDHCAQYIDEGTGIQYHGVGASHGCSKSTRNINSVPKDSLKFLFNGAKVSLPLQGKQRITKKEAKARGTFASVSVGRLGLVVTHFDDKGEKLATAPPLAPRRIPVPPPSGVKDWMDKKGKRERREQEKKEKKEKKRGPRQEL